MNKQPQIDTKIELPELPELSFEFGDEIEKMTGKELLQKLRDEKINLPTKEQWEELLRPVLDIGGRPHMLFGIHGALSDGEIEKKLLLLKQIREKYGLKPEIYWSSTNDDDNRSERYFANFESGFISTWPEGVDDKKSVRLVKNK